jgi:hypothetical protein
MCLYGKNKHERLAQATPGHRLEDTGNLAPGRHGDQLRPLTGGGSEQFTPGHDRVNKM